jgi:uncharacterized membrane protein
MVNDQLDQKLTCDMSKLIAISSYLFFVGWFVALLMYGKHRDPFARFHLRQSLGLLLTFSILSFIPLVGWLLNIVVIVFWFIGFIGACTGQKKLVPWLGSYIQQHLNFIQ